MRGANMSLLSLKRSMSERSQALTSFMSPANHTQGDSKDDKDNETNEVCFFLSSLVCRGSAGTPGNHLR